MLAVDPQTGALTPLKTGTATITITTSGGLTSNVTIQVARLVTAIAIDQSPLTLTLYKAAGTQALANGGIVTFTATVTPAGYSTTKPVTWQSSDPAVATVSSSGVITAVAAGETDITASIVDEYDSNKVHTSAPIRVTVQEVTDPIPVTGITLNVQNASVAVGGTVQLTPAISPANATNRSVTWQSADPSIATVDGGGLVTGVKEGKVTITVTTVDGAFAASCEVTVTPIAVPAVVPGTTTGPPAANTGDDTNLVLWLIVALAAGGVIFVFYRKRYLTK